MQDNHHHQQPRVYSQRGSLLVGLSIAMLAAGILAIGSAKVAMNTFKDSSGTVIGNQLQVVSGGLASYVSANSAKLISGVAITGVAAPLSPTVQELITLNYLNSGVTTTPTIGGAYKTGVSVTPSGCTTECQVIGAVYLTNPIYTADNSSTDIRLLGAAMAASKTSQIGFSQPRSPSSITGPGWVYANPDPSQRPGILLATALSASSSTSSTSSTSALYWLKSAADLGSLPTTGNTLSDGRLARDTGKPYMWTGVAWQELFNNSNNTLSIGTGSGKSGANSSYLGYGAGSNSTGSFNVFTGSYSGQLNSTGHDNVFTGYTAGSSNSTGWFNVFTGSQAGRLNSTGYANVFTGFSAGQSNSTGNNNVFTGYSAGMSNSTGFDNVLTGAYSGILNSTGTNNVFTGNYSGRFNSTGFHNVFTGHTAGYYNSTGVYNVFTGSNSGNSNTTGSQNSLFGSGSNVASSNLTNATAIGSQATAPASNSVRLGNTAVTYIGGQVAWTNASDARLKTNVRTTRLGLDFINKLNPVEYNLNSSPTIPQTGFIAQQVETVNPEFSGIKKPASDKDFYGLTYTDFIPPMVKAIQELDARTSASAVASLQNRVSILIWATAVLGALVLLLGGCVGVLWRRLNAVIAAQHSAPLAL